MKKNTSGQVVGAQLNSRTDGSPITTGTVTVYVTSVGGGSPTQAVGSVGSGAATHEGQGFWTYAPAQDETNYDHVAFTFTIATAVHATIQLYPSFPQTGDNYARLGAPAGASVSADVAAVKSDTAATLTDTAEIGAAGAGLTGITGVTLAASQPGVTIPTVTTLTGHTPQTGDSFARLGAPSGASVSADILAERGKYQNGAVWIGPSANTNTVSYVDGIITNPVSTIAAAKTIADALLLRRFHTVRTGASQIGEAMTGYSFEGTDWSVTTTGGSRDVGTSTFNDAKVIGGTFASTTGSINWNRCYFANGVSIGASNSANGVFEGTTTLNVAGDYNFVDSVSGVAGTGVPVFAVPAGTVNISFRRWSGGISITGITSTTTISIDVVSGGTVTLAGADGNVQVRGMVTAVTDSRTGSPTLGTTAVINQTTIADVVWDEAIAGHADVGSTGEALNAAGAAGDPWTTALPGAYGAGSAGNIVGNNLNAVVSTLATQASVDVVDGIVDNILIDTAVIGVAGAGLTALATQASLDVVDGIVDSILVDTAVIGAAGAGLTGVALSTAGNEAAADALLARSIIGGANGGRDVKDALKALRNKVAIAAGTMTIYEADDTTAAWTAAVTTTAGDPLSSIDPA